MLWGARRRQAGYHMNDSDEDFQVRLLRHLTCACLWCRPGTSAVGSLCWPVAHMSWCSIVPIKSAPQAGQLLGTHVVSVCLCPHSVLSVIVVEQSWLDFCVHLMLACSTEGLPLPCPNMAPAVMCQFQVYEIAMASHSDSRPVLGGMQHMNNAALHFVIVAADAGLNALCRGSTPCVVHTCCSAASADGIEANINSYDDKDKMPLGAVAWAGRHPILYGGAADGSVLVFYLNP